jgi:4-hydroxy-2-oxoheptanedioate aldolase
MVMPAPQNRLKAALARGEVQLGCWLSMATPVSAEIAGGAGFDWVLIDGEHAPNDLSAIRAQLQALNGSPSSVALRVPFGEPWILKRMLDLGVQSLLVPMIDTGEQARAMVRAVRYPPHGMRGVGSGFARVSGYGAIPDYQGTADAQICLMVQAESRKAIENIDDLAGTDGVDVVFIGPSDLSADMGYLGNPGAPEVVEAIHHGIARIRAAGKAVGIIAFGPGEAKRWADAGVQFIATASDVMCLAGGLREIAKARA